VPLSEIALFRPFGLSSEQVGLSARWRPYLFLKGWYDRPTGPTSTRRAASTTSFNRYGLRDHDFELEKAPASSASWPSATPSPSASACSSTTAGPRCSSAGCASGWGGRSRSSTPASLGLPPGRLRVTGSSHDGIKLQPDVVAIGLCLNDLHTGISLYAYEPPSAEQPLEGARSCSTRCRRQLARAPSTPGRAPDYAQLVRDEPQQWDEVQGALRRTHEALAAAGIRLLVVPLPMVSGLAHYPYAELHAMVAAFCEAEGIEHLDLLPRFLGQDERSLWVHPTDQHPNDRASGSSARACWNTWPRAEILEACAVSSTPWSWAPGSRVWPTRTRAGRRPTCSCSRPAIVRAG
jgi:hypothetical protein